MKTKALKSVKMFSLILAICLTFLAFTVQASAQSLNLDSDADVTLLPGDLALLEVPRLDFNVFIAEIETGTHDATGQISGKISIEDVRYTGKSWTLKVSLGEFASTTSSNGTMPKVQVNIGAPSMRSTMNPTDTATGYPVTLVSGSKEYKTIAVSGLTNGNLNAWEGTIAQTDIKVPTKEFKISDGSEYKATMYWSIEDTP